MIRLNINFDPKDSGCLPNDYDNKVLVSLRKVRASIHRGNAAGKKERKSKSKGKGTKPFDTELWGRFKEKIWEAQEEKCAYCEERIKETSSQLEHYRPKSRVTNNDSVVAENGYWWLAYDWRNYIVSCDICNNRKGTRFPLSNKNDRVTDERTALNDDGQLGAENPLLINPRFEDPGNSLAYEQRLNAGPPMTFVRRSDTRGESSIEILDLNRTRTVRDRKPRNPLPRNRGEVLERFKKAYGKYSESLQSLASWAGNEALMTNEGSRKMIHKYSLMVDQNLKILRKQFCSSSAEFSGMCLWWLRNALDVNPDQLFGE